MMRQLKALVASQVKEFYREPEVVFWAFFFPVLLSWVLGIAFDVRGESARVVGALELESNRGGTLHKLIEKSHQRYAGSSSKYFSAKNKNPFEFMFTDKEGALRAIKQGKIEMFIELATDGKIKYYYDPKNSDARLSFLLLEKYFFPPEQHAADSEPVPLVLPGSRYIDFLIPGLLGLEIMNSSMWGIAWSLIEMRSKKLLRRMAASPMNRNVYVLSQIITRLAFGVVEFLAIYLFAFFYFKVRIEGSIAALIMVFISSNIAFGGLAFLLGAHSASTRVGNGIINAVTLPMMMLSGIFFSYHNFPSWAIPMIKLLPLTLITDCIRAIFLESAGIPRVLLPSCILFASGIIFTAASLKIFKWY
jgi:ABC-2 type transport system permease protein